MLSSSHELYELILFRFSILMSTPDGSQMLLETIRAENQELKEFLNRVNTFYFTLFLLYV